jgi:hypothetical protein
LRYRLLGITRKVKAKRPDLVNSLLPITTKRSRSSGKSWPSFRRFLDLLVFETLSVQIIAGFTLDSATIDLANPLHDLVA